MLGNILILIFFYGTAVSVNLNDLTTIHNETQALALEIKDLSTTSIDKSGLDQTSCISDECLKAKRQLDQSVPQLVALIRQAITDYQPLSPQGIDFKKMLLPWLQGLVDKCSSDSTSDCFADAFTLNKHAYLPFMSHPNILIAYVQLIKVNQDRDLLTIFAQLPWCLGDSYSVDCGLSYHKGIVWRVDAMCIVSKGNFSTCKDYMRQSSSGIA